MIVDVHMYVCTVRSTDINSNAIIRLEYVVVKYKYEPVLHTNAVLLYVKYVLYWMDEFYKYY